MDRAADRGMLILIWQLSPSQSFLAHSAMRHNGVCMVISCAHLNRILDTGMLSLRQHYSITVPYRWRMFDNGKQIGYGKHVQTVCVTFLFTFQGGEGLVGSHVCNVLPRKRYRPLSATCVQRQCNELVKTWHRIETTIPLKEKHPRALMSHCTLIGTQYYRLSSD